MPKIPQVLADPAGLGRRAVPRDMGGGEGMAAMGQAVGGIGDVAERLLDVQQTTLVNRAISDSSVALSELETQEAQNPDYAGRGARFQKQAQEIRKSFSDGLMPKYQTQFENNYGPMSARGMSRIRSGAWKDTIDTGRATLDVVGRQDAIDAVAAPPGPQRQEKVDGFIRKLAVARGQGLITEQDGVKRSEQFIDEVMGGDVRQLIRENPQAAIEELSNPTGRFTAMTPEKRAIYTDKAVRRYELNLRSEANAISREMRDEEQRRALAEEKAEVVLDGHLEANDVAEVEGWLDDPDNAGILDSESRRFYRRRIKEGGGLGQTVTNTDTYIALSDMTSMDIEHLRAMEAHKMPSGRKLSREEILADRINEAYRDDRLSQTHRDSLIAASEEHRFGQVQKYLKESLDAGIFAVKDPGARVRQQEALAEFTDWRTHPDNRNASRREAMVIARSLVTDATLMSKEKGGVFDLKSAGFIVRDEASGRVDEEASMVALSAAVDRGELDQKEFKNQVVRLTTTISLEQVPNE